MQNLPPVKVSFWLDLWDKRLVREFVTITDVPLCEQVVLNPDNLGKRLHKPNLAFHPHFGVRKDSLSQYVLHKRQCRPNMYIFHVQWVCSPLPNVHHTDLVEIFPELHLRRVAAELVQIPAEEHLSVHDLR